MPKSTLTAAVIRTVNRRTVSLSLAALAIEWLAGCATPRMAPPADVADGAKVLEVDKRSQASGLFVNEGFQLGSYQVADVNRDWKKTSSGQIAGLKGSYTTNGYQYRLKQGEKTMTGECAASALEKSMKAFGGEIGDARNKLSCECRAGSEYATAEMKGTDMDALSGDLKTPSAAYALKPVTKTDRKVMSMGPVGYRVDGGDGPRGAVETLFPGRVWLTPRVQPSEEMGLVCVMTGLMLYQDPASP